MSAAYGSLAGTEAEMQGLTMGIADIADAIRVEEKAVYALAHRSADPLPLRVLKGKRKGAFALTSEISEWIGRNSVPFTDARCYAHEDMRGRED